jgi:CDI toxin restriction endonuclease-like domain
LARGYGTEDLVSDNLIASASGWKQLTSGFKTMDFFNKDTGDLLSLKSLDLGGNGYQSYVGLSRTLNGYVDSVDASNGYARGRHSLFNDRFPVADCGAARG